MLNEDDAEFHFWRANSLSLEGRPVEALSHVMAVLDIEPDHIQSLILIGETYLHDFEELGVEEETANNIALNYFSRRVSI